MESLRAALLLGLFIGALAGCGKKAPPNDNSPPVDVPVAAENYPDDPELSTKRVPLDLSPWGIRGEITAPTGTTVTMSTAGNATTNAASVRVSAGKTFALEVHEALQPLSAVKATWKAKEWLKDEAALLVATEETPNGVAQRFVWETTLGDKKVHLRTPEDTPQTAEQIERALTVAKTITQTDAIKQSMTREKVVRERLEKAKCELKQRVGRWYLTIAGTDVTNDDLADLKDIAGLNSVALAPAPNITADGLKHIVAGRNVQDLHIIRSDGGNQNTPEYLAPLTDAANLTELTFSQHNLNDAGLAIIGKAKSLRTLNIWTSPAPPTITQAGIAHLKGLKLTTLNLSGVGVSEAMLEHLAGMRTLTSLDISNAKIGEGGLQSVARLTNLQHLDVSNSRVGDLALQYLSNLLMLETLNLSNTQVRGYGLDSLATVTKLKTLHLDGSSINDGALAKLKGLHLETLNVSKTSITDAGLKSLATNVDLQRLYLRGTRCTDAGLAHLAPLVKLSTLDLANTDVNGTGLAALKDCKELSELNLRDTLVTSEALKGLANFPALAKVDLSDTPITDAGLETLGSMATLKAIDVRESNVTKVGVAKLRDINKDRKVMWDEPAAVPDPKPVAPPIALNALPAADPTAMLDKFGGKLVNEADKPARVTIGNKDITDADIAHLRDIKNLGVLNLNGCTKLTDACLPYIAQMTALEDLSLNNTGITGDGLVHLKNLTNLRELECNTNPFNIKQVAPLSSLRTLQHLNMKITGDADAVLKFLTGFRRLRQLDLTNITINNRRLIYVKSLSSLEQLTLNSNQLGDRGLQHLMELTKLQELNLQSDLITDAGLKYLEDIASLKVLVLNMPQLTDNGMKIMVKMPELEILRLTNTRITDTGLVYLRNCTKLRELDLRAANIGDKGAANLENLTELELVDLSQTKVTDAGLKVFHNKKELRKLILNDTAITGKGFAPLKELKYLNRVYMARTQFNDEGAAALAEVAEEELELLDLEATPITDAGIARFKKILHLKVLIVNKNKGVTDKAAADIKMFPDIREIQARDSGITGAGISELKKIEGIKVNED